MRDAIAIPAAITASVASGRAVSAGGFDSGAAPRPATPAPLILVVDDEPDACAMLEMLLTDMGYRVATAADGALALQQARARAPDLVLSDLLMPVVDGIAMAKRLRADPLTADIRIVLCSGIAEPRVRALFSGYDGYLEKPYETDALEALMRALAPLPTSA